MSSKDVLNQQPAQHPSRANRQTYVQSQQAFTNSKNLKIATVNLQGMNFLSIHARDKVAGLIEAARKKGRWQLAAITDVAGGSDEHVCYYANEEFLFVTWGRVAILMNPETSRCWRDNGAVTKRMRVSGDENADGLSHRLPTIVLKTGGVRYAFHAVYAPTGNRENHHKVFFADLETCTDRWRSQYKNVYAGDWNSHIGQHDSPRYGRHGLPRQTSLHSQRMLNWLGEAGLWHIDSFVPLRHRGTWQLVRDSRCYELDYFVSDIAPNQPSSRRWQKMSTVCVPLTDHHGKVVTLQLLGRIRQRVKIEDKVMGHSGFDGTPIKPRLRADKMRGPSDGAIAKRNEYETKTGELWAETKRTEQTGEEGRWQRVAGPLV